MDFASRHGQEYYDEVAAAHDGLIVGLDFDGTLAPIVDDPDQAHIHPDAPAVLVKLADRVRAIAVITGRPARQALALGGLDEVGLEIGERGRELLLFGQYGNERWTSVDRRVVSPKPPKGLATLMGRLPKLLREADAADAWIEEKGLAVAVHTRRCADARGSYERLVPILTEAAAANGLDIEPGRMVIEIRSDEMNKGVAVRELTDRLGGTGFVFIGDDLGDVAAFHAVRELRERGLATLLIAVSSDGEQTALQELADAVVDGPAGVIAFLDQLADDIAPR